MAKILVALSGGVDSAVAALLLKQQGHDVSAAYMRTWMNEEGSAILADCPWEEDIRQAKAVAAHLDIPFEVINLIEDYRQHVVDYLIRGYRSGVTPNPDMMCNREMKFGVFARYAREHGFESVATGHYCRLREAPDGTRQILRGLDRNKDQSYFLALVRQEQLKMARFPIGELAKPRVRELAREHNLPNAARKDSQGICFLGKVDINAFLGAYIQDRPGQIVRAIDGTVLGEHAGLHHFTLGQRKGLGIPSNTDFKNYVVVGKDFEKNRLLVAFDEPDAPGLYATDFTLRELSWTGHPVSAAGQIDIMPRYRDPLMRADFEPLPDGTAHIRFHERQRALAPGQIAALYDDEALLGGGFYA
ncbi:tRNA 2-thiouridine(34) synthase MnmA [Ruficoccus amylovorans]|uniref:tRNA-specific 2-thiouridylase MnmA n=1 Tax=Ruficoccus amylovorans TaxID=1804625 RepID=A0A842HFA5_9BACT|nr:tRNA 2-thiouridine(34) synthase MnmA [Ruficoccus amylovorans]MBC2594204.1 tRNA 2-thiouridine(34) synthase MnmA [Ruficoccus amylovorans]